MPYIELQISTSSYDEPNRLPYRVAIEVIEAVGVVSEVFVIRQLAAAIVPADPATYEFITVATAPDLTRLSTIAPGFGGFCRVSSVVKDFYRVDDADAFKQAVRGRVDLLTKLLARRASSMTSETFVFDSSEDE